MWPWGIALPVAHKQGRFRMVYKAIRRSPENLNTWSSVNRNWLHLGDYSFLGMLLRWKVVLTAAVIHLGCINGSGLGQISSLGMTPWEKRIICSQTATLYETRRATASTAPSSPFHNDYTSTTRPSDDFSRYLINACWKRKTCKGERWLGVGTDFQRT